MENNSMADVLNVFWFMLLKGFRQLAEIFGGNL
jgi:hypothetical protein